MIIPFISFAGVAFILTEEACVTDLSVIQVLIIMWSLFHGKNSWDWLDENLIYLYNFTQKEWKHFRNLL